MLFLAAVAVAAVARTHRSSPATALQPRLILLLIAGIPDFNLHSEQTFHYACEVIIGESLVWNVDSTLAGLGMTIDSNGVIRWTTPKVNDSAPEVFVVEVTAENDNGISYETFEIHVYSGTNAPPMFYTAAVIGDLIAETSTLTTVSCRVGDSEGDALVVSADLSALGGQQAQVLTPIGNDEYQWVGEISSPGSGSKIVVFSAFDGKVSTEWDRTKEVAVIGTPPDNIVLLNAYDLGGQGSKIVYKGFETTGQVPVDMNHLVGIIKDGKVYFYHPAQGDVQVSSRQSREALGMFLGGMDQAKAQSAATSTIANYREYETPYPLNTDVLSETGLYLHADTPPDACYVENPLQRWMLVKAEGKDPYYLSPSTSGKQLFSDEEFAKFYKAFQNITAGAGVASRISEVTMKEVLV